MEPCPAACEGREQIVQTLLSKHFLKIPFLEKFTIFHLHSALQGSRERVQQQLAEAGVGGPPVLRARLHSALQDGRGRLVTFLRLPAQASGAEAINANLEKVCRHMKLSPPLAAPPRETQ